MADKRQRSTESDRSQHQEEAIANAEHESKVERSLHESTHVWSYVVVVEAVAEDEKACGASTQHRSKGWSYRQMMK